ncbi:Transglycosylase SLT domain-containing protein [Kytococcus aerolatus]|uniref:Transglycosylase SLT domain-containing protein n=1 Tax=Kytococcus aerolatus TaxID=592308 RepID=A0A212U567_9MICO|nr:lytic transglycosylase domain-containing protein [Kytococcus aerolatus]SNC73402.1 Transglycosylase SLT domain-containing protein [Kytococcus aerolatus]
MPSRQKATRRKATHLAGLDRRLWAVLGAALLTVLLYVAYTLSPTTERAGNIPDPAREAYQNAAAGAEEFDHPCHGLQWEVIAGIGRVESKHAERGKLDDAGRADPPIYGARLDGSGAGGNVTGISDTDGGEIDGDTEYDRAVGPMQFIPTTWEIHGQDGNGDGEKDPQNIHDAALATASLLCGNQEIDLSEEETLRSAIKRYNNSEEYVDDVLTWAERYRR